MASTTTPPQRIEIFVFLVCVFLALVLLLLPDRVQVVVAGRLADVLTAPYHRVRNFITDVGVVGEENARLAARVAELELQMAAQRRAQTDTARTRPPVLDPGLVGDLVPCRVTARKRARFGAMIRIRTLRPALLRPYLGVISARGFLGRISVLEDRRTAWVELLSSPDMALGVEIERTGLLAVLRPRADGFVLDLVARDEDVRPGDRLITSGIVEAQGDAPQLAALGVIPRGLPVGEVTAVATPADQIFKEVVVAPLATFRYNEAVFVVMPPRDRFAPPATRTAGGEAQEGVPAP
jgi:cell shape-determining protein MreC